MSDLQLQNDRFKFLFKRERLRSHANDQVALQGRRRLPLIKRVSVIGDQIALLPYDKVILDILAKRALHLRMVKKIQYRFRAWSASRRRLSAKIAAAERICKRRQIAAVTIQKHWRGRIGRA